MSSSRVVSFDFHNNHRVRRRRRRKGRGTPAGAKVTARSRRGGGRCGTMRWGSHGYKIGINESTACPARLQYFNHEFGSSPTRDGRAKRNAGGLRSAWSAEAASRPWLLARNFERSHGESDDRHQVFFGLENNLSLSCHQRSLRRRRRGTPMRDRLRNS